MPGRVRSRSRSEDAWLGLKEPLLRDLSKVCWTAHAYVHLVPEEFMLEGVFATPGRRSSIPLLLTSLKAIQMTSWYIGDASSVVQLSESVRFSLLLRLVL